MVQMELHLLKLATYQIKQGAVRLVLARVFCQSDGARSLSRTCVSWSWWQVVEGALEAVLNVCMLESALCLCTCKVYNVV